MRHPRAMLRSAAPSRGAPAAVCREGRGAGACPTAQRVPGGWPRFRQGVLVHQGFDRGAPDCHEHRLRELPGACRQPRLAFQELHRLAQLGVLSVHRADVNPHWGKRPIVTRPAEHVVIYAAVFAEPLQQPAGSRCKVTFSLWQRAMQCRAAPADNGCAELPSRPQTCPNSTACRRLGKPQAPPAVSSLAGPTGPEWAGDTLPVHGDGLHHARGRAAGRCHDARQCGTSLPCPGPGGTVSPR